MKSKISPKIWLIPTIGVLLAAAVFFTSQMGGGKDALNEAIEGGELILTSISRNYESVIQFARNDKAQAEQLLESARVALENSKAKLNSAGRTSDEYVLDMLDNYQKLAEASNVMAQGVDNLLLISENLTNAIDYYWQEDFEKASEQASHCLQILSPFSSEFEKSNATLNDIILQYIPSGQRDRLTLGVDQFRNEKALYNQYILVLRSLLEGKEYLQMSALLEEDLRQLQKDIATQHYETVQELLQEIFEILQSLKDLRYQNAAHVASQLDPSWLSNMTSKIAEELRNRLRNSEGIVTFENYFQSLERYLVALRHLERGELFESEQAIAYGLGILAQGQGGDPELLSLYTGLIEAFNTLRLRIKGQPDQG